MTTMLLVLKIQLLLILAFALAALVSDGWKYLKSRYYGKERYVWTHRDTTLFGAA